MNAREAVATFRGHRVPHIDFLSRRRIRIWFAISGMFIVLGLVGVFARGLNFSIDFKGGSQLTFPDRSGATVGDYQRILSRFGLTNATIEIVAGQDCPNGCVNIKTKSLTTLGQATTPSASPSAASPSPSATVSPSASPSPSPSASPAASPAASSTPTPATSPTASASPTPLPLFRPTTLKGDQLRAALARQAHISVDAINEEDVGPTWGSTITRKALVGLIVFLIIVALYISLRFEPKMAGGALAAVLHDIIITIGIYALVGRQITPESVIAFLTILGYSLYDTVVIFDKIKENTESVALVAKEGYTGVANMSLNQTLMRSVNTSLVVLLPIGALLLFGGTTLKNFAFALFVGVASGTYSSIFIASPILALLKEQEPRYQAIRMKAQQRGARPGLRTVPSRRELAAAGNGEGELEPTGATVGAATRGGGQRSGSRPSGGGARARSGGAQARKKKKPQGKSKPRRR
jgi:preprotein translocase SecF subunit